MQPKPVRQSPTPRYPQREQVLAEQTLLKKHFPHRWQRLRGAVGLLLAASLPGCGGDLPEASVSKPCVKLSPAIDPSDPLYVPPLPPAPKIPASMLPPPNGRPDPLAWQASDWIESLMRSQSRQIIPDGGLIIEDHTLPTEEEMPPLTEGTLPPLEEMVIEPPVE